MDSMRNTQRTSPMSVLEGKQTSGAGIDFTDDFVDMTAACMLPSNNKTHQLVMKVITYRIFRTFGIAGFL